MAARQPLALERIAAAKDEDIDFSDIPELDEGFWREAELVEPDPTGRTAIACSKTASGRGR
ncbi:MAG: hypothetical protein OXI22_21930 [Defluviicoccus sp.]|nr:hypothetical protein [Defluviicoccus sp.]MDE0386554.1 hypothetical protein [Defluviicoccus sp.]